MVDIIPYEEDDEDSSLWVPLSSTIAPNSDSHAENSSAPESHGSRNDNSVGTTNNEVRIARNDCNKNESQAGISSESSIPIIKEVVEDGDSDSDERPWQRPSSNSLQQPTCGADSSESRLQPAEDTKPSMSLWSWENQLISHLTSTVSTVTSNSTTKTDKTNDTARTAATTPSLSEIDERDNVSDSQEKIVWKRIDGKDESSDDIRRGGYDSNGKIHRSSIEEEYDDEQISFMTFSPRATSSSHHQNNQQEQRLEDPKSISTSQHQHNQEENDGIFETLNSNNKKDQQTHHSKNSNTAETHTKKSTKSQHHHHTQRSRQQQQSAKEILQQKLIYDPMRALPSYFLRHLYKETKHQFHLAWQSYRQHNGSDGMQRIFAPLSLVAIFILFGMALIMKGFLGLLFIFIPAFVQAAAAFLKVLMSFWWRITHELVWVSVCTSLVLGLMIWSWCAFFRKSSEKEKQTNADSNSALKSSTSAEEYIPLSYAYDLSQFLPWIVALTSSSSYQVLIILFSIRLCISMLFPRGDVRQMQMIDTELCDSSFDYEQSHVCFEHEESSQQLMGGNSYTGKTHTVLSVLVAMVIAGMIVSIVACVANVFFDDAEVVDQSNNISLRDQALEINKEEIASASSTVATTESTMTPSSSFNDQTPLSHSSPTSSSGQIPTTSPCLRGKYSVLLNKIDAHLCKCHVVSVFTLAFLSIFFSATHVLYKQYRQYLQYGGSITSMLLNMIGSVGVNAIYIVLGILLLLIVGSKTFEFITSKKMDENNSDFLNTISFNQIARDALKNALLEISSITYWNNNDGFSGILSDDDGTLRIAVLVWLIDRWALSSTPPERYEPNQMEVPINTAPSSSTANLNVSDKKSNHGAASDSSGNTNSSNSNFNKGANRDDRQSALPSYRTLQNVISALDADEALIPTVDRYRTWVHSLPPSLNVAMTVAIWKMCPGMAVLGLITVWCLCRWIFSIAASVVCIVAFGLVEASNDVEEGVVERVIVHDIGMFGPFFTSLVILSPLLLVEYRRVCRCWNNVNDIVKETEDPTSASDKREHKKSKGAKLSEDRLMSMSILLASDEDLLSKPSVKSDSPSSSLNATLPFSPLEQMWLMLLDSIQLLESGVPVVRCATVACAAADLANDSLCLFDLALEVKQKGLLGSIGMIIWDAFNYHLSMEISQREKDSPSNTNCNNSGYSRDDLGGQYTGAAVKACGNVEKLTRNIKSLIDPINQRSSKSGYSFDNDQSQEDVSIVEVEETPKNSNKIECNDMESLDGDVNPRGQVSCKDTMKIEIRETEEDPANSEVGEKSGLEIDGTQLTCSNDNGGISDTSDQVNQEAAATSIVSADDSAQGQDEKVRSQSEQEKHESNDGTISLILGGLAIAGAVVGGIVFNTGSEESKHERRRQNTSEKND